MYTNSQIRRETETCCKRSTNFLQIEEEAVASTLEKTKIAVCRKLDGSCPFKNSQIRQVEVSSDLSSGVHGMSPGREIWGMFWK